MLPYNAAMEAAFKQSKFLYLHLCLYCVVIFSLISFLRYAVASISCDLNVWLKVYCFLLMLMLILLLSNFLTINPHYYSSLTHNHNLPTSSAAGRNLPMIDKSFIYIIIDSAKNNLRKTEYKITNNLVGDSWVKLKRGTVFVFCLPWMLILVLMLMLLLMLPRSERGTGGTKRFFTSSELGQAHS